MPKKSATQPTHDAATETPSPVQEATQTRTEAAHAPIEAAPKRRRQPTTRAAEPETQSPADAQPGVAPANAEKTEEELVVFAFRLTRNERDAIHAAAGSARASRFVRGLAIAGARGDLKTIEALIAETETR